ncbi:MAG: peptidylprolyl isomerase [Deltaproteobacteria bacterium]|nr:peptidylprolyl isomerase [Deltaproteobacteria bacterium]
MITRALAISLSCLTLCTLACGDKTMLAKVGDTKLHQSDLDAYVAGRSELRSSPDALQELIDSAILAEGARRRGLLDDPLVRARVEQAAREVLRQALVDRAREAVANPQALTARYEAEKVKLSRRQVHVASIVLHVVPGKVSLEQARAKAFELRGKALQGADFQALARENSQDPTGPSKGGDLGPLLEGQVDSVFFTAAAGLKKGELSQPVELGYGVFLLKALDEPRLVTPTFDEARPRLEVAARNEAEARLLADLRAAIPVEQHPERLPAKAAAAR